MFYSISAIVFKMLLCLEIPDGSKMVDSLME